MQHQTVCVKKCLFNAKSPIVCFLDTFQSPWIPLEICGVLTNLLNEQVGLSNACNKTDFERDLFLRTHCNKHTDDSLFRSDKSSLTPFEFVPP